MERLANSSGTPLDTCPTCGSVEKVIDEEFGIIDRVNGTYKLDGVEHACDCEEQILLRKHYLLAGIGDQYMRLNWDKEFSGDPNAGSMVATYLDNLEAMRMNGMGIEFSAPELGVGKTFAATHIAKVLIKNGQRVKFVHFIDMVETFKKSDAEALEEELRKVTYLVLDEVLPPVSAAQGNLFAPKLESIIRHRTNFNLPTIMTTNLTKAQLEEHYPRTYSLLAAKQIRVEMDGKDMRKGEINTRNLELIENGERRPIN